MGGRIGSHPSILPGQAALPIRVKSNSTGKCTLGDVKCFARIKNC